jgi:hypothetical protein
MTALTDFGAPRAESIDHPLRTRTDSKDRPRIFVEHRLCAGDPARDTGERDVH